VILLITTNLVGSIRTGLWSLLWIQATKSGDIKSAENAPPRFEFFDFGHLFIIVWVYCECVVILRKCFVSVRLVCWVWRMYLHEKQNNSQLFFFSILNVSVSTRIKKKRHVHPKKVNAPSITACCSSLDFPTRSEGRQSNRTWRGRYASKNLLRALFKKISSNRCAPSARARYQIKKASTYSTTIGKIQKCWACSRYSSTANYQYKPRSDHTAREIFIFRNLCPSPFHGQYHVGTFCHFC